MTATMDSDRNFASARAPSSRASSGDAACGRAWWVLGMGLTILALGVDSVRTGKWVAFGRVGDAPDLPGWAVILMALFLLFISGSILRRFVRKT